MTPKEEVLRDAMGLGGAGVEKWPSINEWGLAQARSTLANLNVDGFDVLPVAVVDALAALLDEDEDDDPASTAQAARDLLHSIREKVPA